MGEPEHQPQSGARKLICLYREGRRTRRYCRFSAAEEMSGNFDNMYQASISKVPQAFDGRMHIEAFSCWRQPLIR